MAIDIRATVTCSLGTLISGSISDDYIQGSGLVKTRGSVEISGTITPAIGSAVTFSYTKGGVTRSIPRKLRVLSSFADPFRRTTKVELGCKLTYLSDLKEPVDWTAFDDPENAGYDVDDARIVTLPIYASSVMNKCLTELGITASSNPLTNKFSIAAFDFSAGYVSVLNDLLVSESYCGYLDTNEVLQVFNLDQDAGTGPVFTSADIVDLAPIGVGQLPGEAVTVSYSSLKLKEPEDDEDTLSTINWEKTVAVSSPETYYINYRDSSGALRTKTYTASSATTTVTNYRNISVPDGQGGFTSKEVVANRTVTEEVNAIAKLSNCAAKYAEIGASFSNDSISTVTRESYAYDSYGNQTGSASLKSEPAAVVLGAANFDWVYGGQPYPASYDSITSEYTEVRNIQSGTFTQTTTSTYLRFAFTQAGQQAIAVARELGADTVALAQEIADAAIGGGLVHANTITESKRTGATAQERPPAADRINAAYSKGGDPNNGWRTESKADLELAVGSATAQRRIELSLPYAPDDTFSGPSGGPFTATASDAPVKANRYGRVQNRLLLGNRSGINLQLAPEKLPAAPYSPLYVQVNGLTALYRANGTNWAFDANGIVCSVDALFWAAVGGTGTFWFPVAPGITTLPTTPPVVAGEMTATATVLPYNETAIYDSRIRLTTALTKFDYALELLTVVPASVIRTRTLASRILKVEVSAAAALSVTAEAPVISTGAAVTIPATGVAVNGEPPTVGIGAAVVVPNADLVVAAWAPTIDSGLSTTVLVPSLDIAIAAEAPAISTGTSVSVPTADIAIAALAPTGVGDVSDPNFASVSLLLHLDGSNGGTTFTDSSSNNVSITRGGNAQLSTTYVKYGTASVVWDGSGDFLRTPSDALFTFGTGNFTIEFWSYFDASFNTGAAAILMSIGAFRNITYTASTLRFRTDAGTNLITGGALNLSQWYHIALTKSGNDHRLFIDGTQTGSTYTSTTSYTADRITFGANNSGTFNYLGNMDDIRVTKGVARYTANFTAPTKAFPDL